MDMRNAHRHGFIALACGLLVGFAWIILPAKAHAVPNSADKVKATATATRPDADGNQTVTITLKIESPWHLYANPVGNDMLTDAQTTISFKAKEKPQVVKIDYPAGTLEKDKAFGDYRIYEGTVTIKAQLRRAKGDTSSLQAEINVQACRKGTCLLGGTVKLNVP
jgi:DsbC/DsbD-like thiol-disulfide interchange protein